MESDKKNRSNNRVHVIGLIVIGCVVWIVLYVLDPLRNEAPSLKDTTSVGISTTSVPAQLSNIEKKADISFLNKNSKPTENQESDPTKPTIDQNSNPADPAKQVDHKSNPTKSNEKSNPTISKPKRNLNEYIKELYELGISNPHELVRILEETDPLQTSTISKINSCEYDYNNRIDFPTIYTNQTLTDFRNHQSGTFIFYQHLRKAGGTAFCTSASQNMISKVIPPYYCMPDNRGSLATPPWNNPTFLLNHIHQKGYRIVANEWDAFYESFFNLPGAVFATTFRHPIDRWYSQYRFEHLEHRDGSLPNSPRIPMLQWYRNQRGWTMGTNYYINTFIGDSDLHPPSVGPNGRTGDFYWTYHKYNHKPISYESFLRALKNIRRFHIILVTERLDHSQTLLENGLGWTVAPLRVLPHEIQAKRSEKDKLVGRVALRMLSTEDYNQLADENALDLLFFTIAKRIFLERLQCSSS